VGGQVDQVPAGQRGEEGGLAGGVDRAGDADGDRPDVLRGLARLAQAGGEDPVQGGEPFGGIGVGGDRAPGGVDHVAVEVGEERQYLVAADVDAEDVARGGVEAVAAGRPADRAAGPRFDDRGPAAADQALGDDVDRGPGQPGQAGELGDGGGRLIAQRAHHRQRVEFAQPRQIRTGDGLVGHGRAPLGSGAGSPPILLRSLQSARAIAKCYRKAMPSMVTVPAPPYQKASEIWPGFARLMPLAASGILMSW
jgi:hypothetical protein